MDKETLEFIIGIIFLILIVNTIGIWSIATTNNSQNFTAVSVDASDSSPNSPSATIIAPATPTAVPVKKPPASGSKAQTPVPTEVSYITLETPEPVVMETRPLVQYDFARRSDEGYKTLYSLSNQIVSEQMPRINVNAANPPIIVNYDFIPINTTDIKFLEYKKTKTKFEGNVTTIRPYENAWFSITVRDKDSGEIIAEDGIGKNYGFQSPKTLVIQHGGLIGIECAGKFGNVTLEVKMKLPA
jgi:hypothetical protein